MNMIPKQKAMELISKFGKDVAKLFVTEFISCLETLPQNEGREMMLWYWKQVGEKIEKL